MCRLPQALVGSGGALAIPLLTSSLTTVFAFLPMLLIKGNSGEYVRSLAQVVAILLLGSWFLSMTWNLLHLARMIKDAGGLPRPAWAWAVPPYAIGSLAVFWVIQRIAAF